MTQGKTEEKTVLFSIKEDGVNDSQEMSRRASKRDKDRTASSSAFSFIRHERYTSSKSVLTFSTENFKVE
jgi:hypothetical protein